MEIKFDALDENIVAMLKENGRVTNREIADNLGVTRAIVGTRIARMTEANALRIVAAADFSAYGYDVLLAIAVNVVGRAAEDVARELSDLAEVFAVHLVTGQYQIELLVAARNFGELSSKVVTGISGVRGIANIDVAIVTDIVTYRFDLGISR
jgi:Lrp/AsnC family leucine-responsive transcriptional regulator